MMMKRIKELENENKRLRDGAASIARGQALVDEFGDYEVLIECLQGLRKKLSIAVEALKYYADSDNWCDCQDTFNNIYKKGCLEDDGYEKAKQALKEIAI
jgi:hypothetical protein